MDSFYIILTGSLVAVSCALLGCYLVMRKMAMIGDAISHAVLPGIVLAFLISGSRDSVSMLIGAGLLGILSTVMIEFFHTKVKIQSDASIGITFTFLFALGIILISVFAGQVDLDQDCVLYGEIAYVPLDLWITDGTNLGPRALWVLVPLVIVIILFIVFNYKELLVTTFDSGYAAAIGLSTALWHYLLMGLVSLTTVASFESVGAILVVGFLITPPATAYLLTKSFKTMLILSALIGIASAVSGFYVAMIIDGSIAGAMATMAGIFFLLAVLFSPMEGILVKRFRTEGLKLKAEG